MKKRIFVIMLVAMILVLTACGNTSTVNEASSEVSTEVEATETVDSEAVVEPTKVAESTETEVVETADSKAVVETTETVVVEVESNEVAPQYTYTDISTMKYAQSSVNVRDMPSADGNKIDSLKTNDEVSVTGQCNETSWYRIEYNGSEAFVSNKYLGDSKVEVAQANNSSEQSAPSGDWVGNLQVAQNTNQMIVVAASGSSATLSMHNKNSDGSWTEILSTSASIGKNGIGKTAEGDKKTPQGIYGFSFAFGIQPNPGTALSYTQVDDSYYWVDDSNSAYYNQFVSTNNVACDWSSAEHITSVGSFYNYVLAINYNSACVPGLGSAIFLHCNPTGGTAGCIAVSESSMITILQNIQPGCTLIVDSTNGVYNY